MIRYWVQNISRSEGRPKTGSRTSTLGKSIKISFLINRSGKRSIWRHTLGCSIMRTLVHWTNYGSIIERKLFDQGNTARSVQIWRPCHLFPAVADSQPSCVFSGIVLFPRLVRGKLWGVKWSERFIHIQVCQIIVNHRNHPSKSSECIDPIDPIRWWWNHQIQLRSKIDKISHYFEAKTIDYMVNAGFDHWISFR